MKPWATTNPRNSSNRFEFSAIEKVLVLVKTCDISEFFHQQILKLSTCVCFRQIQCREVLLEDMDVSKALLENITVNSIEFLVLGAPSRGGLVR